MLKATGEQVGGHLSGMPSGRLVSGKGTMTGLKPLHPVGGNAFSHLSPWCSFQGVWSQRQGDQGKRALKGTFPLTQQAYVDETEIPVWAEILPIPQGQAPQSSQAHGIFCTGSSSPLRTFPSSALPAEHLGRDGCSLG